MKLLVWYSRRRGSTTSARYSAGFTDSRLLSGSPTRSLFWCTNVNTVWRRRTCLSTSRHWSHTTIVFRIVNVSSRPTHLAVYRRRQSAFPIASAHLWNSLPSHVTTALPTFQSRLKSHLFSLSYHNPLFSFLLFSARAVTRHFGHYRLIVLTFYTSIIFTVTRKICEAQTDIRTGWSASVVGEWPRMSNVEQKVP